MFVLLIACINFTNLATASAAKRAKEVGVRKVVGAGKNQLINQFLGESLLLSLVSGLGAALLVVLVFPVFSRFAGKDMTLLSLLEPCYMGNSSDHFFRRHNFWSLPGIFLIRFSASGFAQNREFNVWRVDAKRSCDLPVCPFYRDHLCHPDFQEQMNYIQSENLGYDKEQILVIPLNKDLRQLCSP